VCQIGQLFEIPNFLGVISPHADVNVRPSLLLKIIKLILEALGYYVQLRSVGNVSSTTGSNWCYYS